MDAFGAAPIGQQMHHQQPSGFDSGAHGRTLYGQPQQQQQQQAAGLNGAAPWAAAAGHMWNGGPDAMTTQMGVQFGRSAVAAGSDYVEKNVRPFYLFILVICVHMLISTS